MTTLKLLGLGAAIVIVTFVALLFAIRLGVFNPSYSSVKAKYGAGASRFPSVDGVVLHISDEGSGAPVVLIHGSYTNLHLWDPWAERLKSKYRVIRLDWPPYGLSVDPTDMYSNPREEMLLSDLLDKLNLRRVILVGTSNGAILAVMYAAKHPDRVRALALSTLPIFPPDPNHYVSPSVKVLQWVHKTFTPNYFPRFYYSLFLRDLIPHRDRITPALVDQFYFMNNLPGAFARQDQYVKSSAEMFASGIVPKIAQAVTSPVLIQWGDANTVLLPSNGDRSAAQFVKSKVTMIHYAGVGHYPMWEVPDRTVADFLNFVQSLPAE